MTTYDLHQHLWPETFVRALRQRKTAPRLDGNVLETCEGRFEVDLAQHDPETRLAALDRDEIDVAVLSLQPSLGLRDLATPECEELELEWADAVRELDSTRFRAFSPSRVREGFAGVSLGSSSFVDFDAVAPTLDAATVEANLASPSQLLVDARGAERYRGDVEPMDPVPGHIPGAVNRPYAQNLNADATFKSASALRAEFDALLGGRSTSEVVHQCGSGVSACHNLLAMEVAGLHGSRLYPGSWSEWCADPAHPVARG